MLDGASVVNNNSGVFKTGAGTVTLTDCSVLRNIYTNSYSGSTSYGGGITVTGAAATLTMTDCSVNSNTAYRMGGGIHINGATATLADVTVSGCNNQSSGTYKSQYTYDNKTTPSPYGAGIYSYSANLSMTGCTVSSCGTNNVSYIAGSAVSCSGGTADFADCAFTSNGNSSSSNVACVMAKRQDNRKRGNGIDGNKANNFL